MVINSNIVMTMLLTITITTIIVIVMTTIIIIIIIIIIHIVIIIGVTTMMAWATPSGCRGDRRRTWIRSISEISSCCFGPRPWHIEIRHRVNKKTSTINLFGFETLKLKIRRLKLWKPTVTTM